MENIKLDRINELSRKSRVEPLSVDELAEQDVLRKEYIAAYRANLKQTLDNIEIVDTEQKVSKRIKNAPRKKIHRVNR